jgi:hypothetical protein
MKFFPRTAETVCQWFSEERCHRRGGGLGDYPWDRTVRLDSGTPMFLHVTNE